MTKLANERRTGSGRGVTMACRSLALATALVAALTACSGDDDGGGSSDSDSGSGTGTAAALNAEFDTSEALAELPDVKPIASRTSSSSGNQLRMDVYPLEITGSMTVLHFAMTLVKDDQGDGYDPNTMFSDGNSEAIASDGFTVDGVQLIDTANAKVYLPASDGSGTCICSQELGNVSMEQDETVVFSAMFAAPPEDVDTVNVSIPEFGTFVDAPIG